MTPIRVPVLAYHGYNVAGNDYANNDHVALAEDLRWLAGAGWTVVPLEQVVRSVIDGTGPELPPRSIAITFDDATDLDWQDVEFGEFGPQRSLHGVLEDQRRSEPEKPAPHATSFVIASPEARSLLARKALQHGHGMHDDWWRIANQSPLMRIGNHSWDHRHPLVVADAAAGREFLDVDHFGAAMEQVVRAGDFIGSVIGTRPRLFAYPWGQASSYLREVFFPAYRLLHGCTAAFSTEAGVVHSGADRWYLPRFVCGHHWRGQDELAQLLAHELRY